jgi:hypothetical protein
MTLAWTRQGRRVFVGNGAVVPPGTALADGASVDALSLLMKGETLPWGTRWAGAPAIPAEDRSAPAFDPRPHRGRWGIPGKEVRHGPVVGTAIAAG